MAVPFGSPIVAANDGVVSFAGSVAGELFITVDHPDGIRTTCSFVSAVLVRRGDRVLRGQRIGLSGPGHAGSTTPHLHFGARIGDAYIDPEPLLSDGLRRDLSQAIRLAPIDASGGPAGARGSIPAVGPALIGACALRLSLRRRSRAAR
jgi:murein DD-endopeptidase MepM/ murein hydrolase activator NlpD